MLYRNLQRLLVWSVLTLAACSGAHSTPSALPNTPQANDMPQTRPSFAPYAFAFRAINDPKSKKFTRIGGLDDLRQVIGSVQISPNGYTSAFTSQHPYQSYVAIPYPGAASTVATAVNPGGKVIVGYYLAGKDHDTRGFVRESGMYTSYANPRTPKGGKTLNELTGINDAEIAVGFYEDRSGHDHPYELANGVFVSITPPGAVSATANAISLADNVAGSETLKDGTIVGWLLRAGAGYTQFSYPKSRTTLVNGLSDAFSDNQVVGSYLDKRGMHGFILSYPFSPSQRKWQSVDEPEAKGVTVIAGMNNHHDIGGWYVDASGKTHGFVGTPKSLER
jgi:hypothetical protein